MNLIIQPRMFSVRIVATTRRQIYLGRLHKCCSHRPVAGQLPAALSHHGDGPQGRGCSDYSFYLLALAALCFLLIAPIVSAEALSEADVKNLLARIRENRITQADFQEERVIRLMKKPIVNSGKVSFQPPNKFRREAKGSSPSLTVSDGQQLWIYYPNFKSAERYSLGKRSPLDSVIASINSALNLENVENTFNISATRAGNGYELELTPRTTSMKRAFQKLNLLINDKLQAERTDMLQPNGDRIVTVYSNQSRAPIPPSMFEFTPPPGTDVSTPLGR